MNPQLRSVPLALHVVSGSVADVEPEAEPFFDVVLTDPGSPVLVEEVVLAAPCAFELAPTVNVTGSIVEPAG